MLWYEAIILGLVEGITEYLPISSTGHLIIASSLLGLDSPEETKRAVDAFTIIVQGGAILAVAGLYWKRIAQMVSGLLGRDTAGRRLFVNLMLSFLPAAILGPILNDAIERYLFFPIPVMAALAIGGAVLIALRPWQQRHFEGAAKADPDGAYIDLEALTWRPALVIGLLQCVAMWPGTSRSMMTIVGAMLIGMRPKQAAEYSFLLGLPTLGGACLYKTVQVTRTDGVDIVGELGLTALLIGFVVATISAALAVRWLVSFLSRHGLAVFGWYRIGLCVVLGLLWYLGVVNIVPAG